MTAQLPPVTKEQLEELMVGLRLRRAQLQKQAEELPSGTAKGIVWAKADRCTQLLAEYETVRRQM